MASVGVQHKGVPFSRLDFSPKWIWTMIEATSGGDSGSGANQCGVRHFLSKEHRKTATNTLRAPYVSPLHGSTLPDAGELCDRSPSTWNFACEGCHSETSARSCQSGGTCRGAIPQPNFANLGYVHHQGRSLRNLTAAIWGISRARRHYQPGKEATVNPLKWRAMPNISLHRRTGGRGKRPGKAVSSLSKLGNVLSSSQLLKKRDGATFSLTQECKDRVKQ
ncbi:hypothetical protein S7711_11287 [Stachybotrys chartarum IBT 7711]|uniref:Uncharacterized protein n=1 Tax=Stachybotrys chartarum (strain CBS 109288 / IBT 7711) TaxID=1280523 RepID=A0A084AWY1_STACB|nr:hypothetical protein S7711_11287 [Stachybotrys chartarum IBT 7711]KFA75949.1 hypothetical protein S40288_11064 [Stachybotrys chartarum IBT 40288]